MRNTVIPCHPANKKRTHIYNTTSLHVTAVCMSGETSKHIEASNTSLIMPLLIQYVDVLTQWSISQALTHFDNQKVLVTWDLNW